PRERTVEWAAGERGAHDGVLLRGVEKRHRRCALAEIRTRNLAGVLRLTGAVEDVVCDLERDPEREAVAAEGRRAARTEQARRLEELAGLQSAPRQVIVDRRLWVPRLPALHRLAPRERETGVGKERDLRIGGVRELGERAGEEVVARGERRVGPEHRPCRRNAAPHAGAVDEVVVDECRHVYELDRNTRSERRRRARRRREEAEQRS